MHKTRLLWLGKFPLQFNLALWLLTASHCLRPALLFYLVDITALSWNFSCAPCFQEPTGKELLLSLGGWHFRPGWKSMTILIDLQSKAPWWGSCYDVRVSRILRLCRGLKWELYLVCGKPSHTCLRIHCDIKILEGKLAPYAWDRCKYHVGGFRRWLKDGGGGLDHLLPLLHSLFPLSETTSSPKWERNVASLHSGYNIEPYLRVRGKFAPERSWRRGETPLPPQYYVCTRRRKILPRFDPFTISVWFGVCLLLMHFGKERKEYLQPNIRFPITVSTSGVNGECPFRPL